MINCHHGPPNVFIPGLSYVRGDGTTDPEANAERYQMSQKQRRLEREVRYAKREAAMLEAAGDTEGTEEARQHVRKRQRILKQFVSENELKRDYSREWVGGYNK